MSETDEDESVQEEGTDVEEEEDEDEEENNQSGEEEGEEEEAEEGEEEEDEEDQLSSDEEREDEDDDDYADFFEGLQKQYVNRVRDARAEYFKQRTQKFLASAKEKVSKDIEDEWKGILSLPELRDATFDFQVLRQLISPSTAQNSNPEHVDKLKLSSQNQQELFSQHRDPWVYDFAAGDDEDEEDEESEEEQSSEEEEDDDEDEGDE